MQLENNEVSDGIRLPFISLANTLTELDIKNKQGECLLQFGKVDDKTFHLDYKVGGRT